MSLTHNASKLSRPTQGPQMKLFCFAWIFVHFLKYRVLEFPNYIFLSSLEGVSGG